MKKNTLVLASIGLAVLATAVIYFGVSISCQNKNTRLKNAIMAKLDEREAAFDKMWKIIQQQAEISDKYRESFAQIYPQLIEGRYKNNGQLMAWIQEHNPEFTPALYQTLMVTIESQRESFFQNQKALLDLNREHRNLVQTWPGSWFLNQSDTIHITVVSSGYTKSVIQSGREDSIKLY